MPVIERRLSTKAFFLLSLSLLAGCQDLGGSRSSRIFPADQVVVDWSNWLKDGASVSWKLDPGTYRLELTANGDGITAEWVGASCPKTQPMRELTMTCEMTHTGQLVVTNPTTFGLGPQVSTTVKVTKLAR